MKKLSLIGFVAVTALVLFTAKVQAQTTIAGWTFESSLPTGSPGAGVVSGPWAAEVGTGSATGLHAAASTYSNPAGNGSSHSFSATAWGVGDYYQFQTSTTGDFFVTIQFDQASSNTGPRDFKLQYSTNGTTFTDFGTYSVLANASPNPTWNGTTSSSIFTLTLGTGLGTNTALWNQSNVYFRMTDVSTTSAIGGTVAATGTDRIDNVIVSGLQNVSFWKGNGSGVGAANGASTNWNAADSNWNTDITGTGTQSAFNTSKAAVFAGTPGAVTIPTSITSGGGVAFAVNGYSINGGTLAIGSSSTTNFAYVVNASDTATIGSQLNGTFGLNKTGLGTLALTPSGNESFSGDLTLTGGTVKIAAPSNLGTTWGNLVMNGGAIQFTAGAGTSFNFDSLVNPHQVSGASGTFILPTNSTMTVNGETDAGTSMGLTGAGSTLKLAYNGGTVLGGFVFNDAATLQVTNTADPSGHANELTLNGNVFMKASGTSTITAGEVFWGGSSLNAQNDDSVLVINADMKSSNRALAFGGTGTIKLAGNNAALTGNATSGTITIGSNGQDGPTVEVKDGNSFGVGGGSQAAAKAVNFNSGTIVADNAATFPSDVKFSIGASGGTTPATFGAGADITIGAAGGLAPVSVFRGSTAVAAPPIRFEVDNHTTFAGGWAAAVSATGATNPAVIIQGTGRLTVNGDTSVASSPGEIYEDLPIITETSVTVEINGKMRQNNTTDWTTANAPSFTLGSRSKLKNGASGNLPSGSNMIFGYSASSGQNLYGGTYQNNGTTQTLNTIKVDAAADALQSSLSTIDMGSAGSLTYAGGSAGGWATGATLRVTNWSAGDPLKIGTSAGLSTAEKAAIHFQGYATGSTQAGDGTVTPIGSKIYFLGDADQDVGHHVNAADILPFENALSNLTGYMTSHSFDVATMYDIFDVNGDQQITGADVGAFLNYLKAGHGSNESVPEPSAVILGLLSAAGFAGVAIRRHKAKVAA